jgi:MoaA/NifB/PqqE/SkfB family radical SAM enzyme
MEAVRASRHGVPFRISTNGLFPASVAAALAAARVGRVTVALATADPRQYEALMQPEAGSGGHAAVCGFVVNLVEAGVEVECTVAGPHQFTPRHTHTQNSRESTSSTGCERTPTSLPRRSKP